MSRNWLIYPDDIVASSEKIRRFTAGMSQKDFQQDERTYDAVVRNLEIIGEAVKHIPDEPKHRRPDIEWRKVAGLRDLLAHTYFGIDDDILWDVVLHRVPDVQQAIEDLRDKNQA